MLVCFFFFSSHIHTHRRRVSPDYFLLRLRAIRVIGALFEPRPSVWGWPRGFLAQVWRSGGVFSFASTTVRSGIHHPACADRAPILSHTFVSTRMSIGVYAMAGYLRDWDVCQRSRALMICQSQCAMPAAPNAHAPIAPQTAQAPTHRPRPRCPPCSGQNWLPRSADPESWHTAALISLARPMVSPQPSFPRFSV
jgi:hypothetical protein